MKKKSQIFSLFITLALLSCKNSDNIIPITDINADFPTSEKLEFKHFNKYDIYGGWYLIEDSVLWNFSEDPNSFGYCYNLNSGERLSTIAMKGKASYEFTQFPGYKFVGDSIQFYTQYKSIKTFSKKDIVESKPMDERIFSQVTCPDTIGAFRMIKLPNGSVLGTIDPPHFLNKGIEKLDINRKSVVIFNDNEAKSYETIKYDSFDVEKIDDPKESNRTKLAIEYQIKSSYTGGIIEVKDNDIAIFTVHNQFMLYKFDINSGKVVKEKRYTKMQEYDQELVNEMRLNIINIMSNDKYILCVVQGFSNKEDKETHSYKETIFVFDWDLNPIKKFDLPYEKSVNYIISNDCRSVYSRIHTEEGLTLCKADLNL